MAYRKLSKRKTRMRSNRRSKVRPNRRTQIQRKRPTIDTKKRDRRRTKRRTKRRKPLKGGSGDGSGDVEMSILIEDANKVLTILKSPDLTNEDLNGFKELYRTEIQKRTTRGNREYMTLVNNILEVIDELEESKIEQLNESKIEQLNESEIEQLNESEKAVIQTKTQIINAFNQEVLDEDQGEELKRLLLEYAEKMNSYWMVYTKETKRKIIDFILMIMMTYDLTELGEENKWIYFFDWYSERHPTLDTSFYKKAKDSERRLVIDKMQRKIDKLYMLISFMEDDGLIPNRTDVDNIMIEEIILYDLELAVECMEFNGTKLRVPRERDDIQSEVNRIKALRIGMYRDYGMLLMHTPEYRGRRDERVKKKKKGKKKKKTPLFCGCTSRTSQPRRVSGLSRINPGSTPNPLTAPLLREEQAPNVESLTVPPLPMEPAPGVESR